MNQQSSPFKVFTAREWVNSVLKKMGYGDRLILEIPIAFPSLDRLQEGSWSNLSDLQSRLVRAIKSLQQAQEEYLNYRNRDCLDRVREASDSLKKFLHDNENFPEALLVRTATCSGNIAPELFGSLTNIVDAVFNFASKCPHAVTKAGNLMDYQPEAEDAEFLIGTTAAVLAYLSRKLEKSVQSAAV